MEFTTVRVSQPNNEAIEKVRRRYDLQSKDQAVGFLLIEAGER